LSGNEAQGIATNRRVRYLGRRIVNQSSASAFDAAASDRQDTFSDRFGNWTFASPEGITPRNPNLPVPPPEPGRALGIFSGKPMPLWTTPVPIGGLLDNSNASSNIDWFTALAGASGSDKKSPASVFDNGAPAVPIVPSDDASFSGGLPGRLAAFLAGTMNEAQTPPPPLQDGAQGISSGKSVPRLVRVNGDNSPASVSDMGALAAPIVPSDDASFSGGLAAWVAALAGVGPQSPNQFAAPPLDDGLRGFYCDDPTQPRDDADLQALDARLSRSGDIKDAVALYKARKSSRC
jgi:hypothetical protein